MFGRPFNIVKLAGINIGIDFSWLFIAILLSWTLAMGFFPFAYPNLTPKAYWLMGIVGMLGLFVSVVLHEMGHALMARRFNVNIEQIILFIFGGVAEMKKEPPSPKAEFLVAIAGPAVSVLIALCMYFVSAIGTQLGWSVLITGVTSYLAMINVVIVIFNLIPAFPLDGGRVLRSILWWWKDNLGWATRISSRLGSGFGFVLIFLGLLSLISGNFFSGIWWMILGLFLHQAASFSRTQYYVKRELENEKVAKFMTKNPISVPEDITIKDFVDRYVYQSHHHLYPVTDPSGKLLGYISLKEVKSLKPQEWEKTHIKDVMISKSSLQTVTPSMSALEALNLIHQSEISTLLVEDNGQLAGLLTSQDLFKVISLKLELEEESG